MWFHPVSLFSLITDNDTSYNSAAYNHFHGVTEEQASSQESAGPPEDWGFTNAPAPAGEAFAFLQFL